MEKIEMTMRKRFGKLHDVFLGEMYLFTASKLVTEVICASFNEHDTLKAKADLFDEMIASLKATEGNLMCLAPDKHRNELVRLIKTLPFKAKEIK